MLRILIIPLMLAGCAFGSQTMAPTKDGISYRVGGYGANPGPKAEKHCAQFGKKAKLERYDRTGQGGGVFTFKCV